MSDVSGNGLIVEQIEESITFNDIQLHLVSEENIQQIDDELDQTNQFISLKNPPKHNYCINRIIKVEIGTIKYIREHSFTFRN